LTRHRLQTARESKRATNESKTRRDRPSFERIVEPLQPDLVEEK